LEETEATVAAASGMAAISSVFMSLLNPGDHIIASRDIYGGTRTFFEQHLSKWGVYVQFVDITKTDEIINLINKNTKLLYTEVIGNPNLVVANLGELEDIKKRNGLVLVVDNTFSPPPVIQPKNYGADIIIHSATKYISGHGDTIGGIVSGTEDLIDRISQTINVYGGTLSPFNAWLAIRGIRTLDVRLKRQCENALAISEYLDTHPAIERVHYPGLTTHPQHKLAKEQLGAFGGILSFDLKGGLAGAKTFMDSVRVCSFTTSLGEIDTLVIHPASTSHINMTPQQRKSIGINDNTIRLSVGIEDLDDLIMDLEQALTQLKKEKSYDIK
jgi:methionine-gamma-lyase